MIFSTGSIANELSAELYSSTLGVVSLEDIDNLHVAIDGRQYLIDVREYRRAVLESQTPQSDDAAEPGEKSLSRAGYWPREQADWSLGAGQTLFDGPESASPRRRYLSSYGWDVWTRHELSMLYDTALRLSSTNTNLDCFTVGGLVHFVDGSFIRYTSDPDVASPSFTSVDFTDSIVDWTTDGDRIYAVFSGSLVPKVITVGQTTVSTLGTTTPDIIEFADGRLVAADGATLYELDSSGAKVGSADIRVDPRTGAEWVAVTGAPSAIFAALNVGDVAEIYAMVVDDVTTGLTAPTYAGGLPYGETVNCMAAYPPGNLVVVGTSKGIRAARIGANGRTLNFGERIDIAGGVEAVELRDRFCWFTWSDPRPGSTGLGRLDLSEGTSEVTFVPAYAEDVQFATTGTVTGVTSLLQSGASRERRYFVVSGKGFYGEGDDRVPEARIETGQIRFGVLVPKIFTGVTVRHEDAPGFISGDLTFDDGAVVSLGGGDPENRTSTELATGGRAGLSASLGLDGTRDDADTTLGPVIRAWEMAALPRPKRVIEYVVPVILRSKVTDLRGHERPFSPLAEMRHLESLAASSRLVPYQEGSDFQRVRVSSVAIAAGGVRSWERGAVTWFEATVLVHMLSKEF